MEALFKLKNGKAQITENVKAIWLLQNFIDTYGEQIAVKIFTVMHFMCDLSKDNPFRELSEIGKLEKIVSAICPETEIDIDWNSYEMLDGIELVRSLYETQSYRYYLTKKYALDKALEEIRVTPFNATKEFGNADQIAKWDKYVQDAQKTTKEAYQDVLSEQQTFHVRGGNEKAAQSLKNGGKEEELD